MEMELFKQCIFKPKTELCRSQRLQITSRLCTVLVFLLFFLHLYITCFKSYQECKLELHTTLVEKSSTLCNFLPLTFKKVAAIPAFVFETRI